MLLSVEPLQDPSALSGAIQYRHGLIIVMLPGNWHASKGVSVRCKQLNASKKLQRAVLSESRKQRPLKEPSPAPSNANDMQHTMLQGVLPCDNSLSLCGDTGHKAYLVCLSPKA